MAHMLDRSGFHPTFGLTFASLLTSTLPLLAVLSWKGELSFFDQLRHRGRIRGWRLWFIPGIPAILAGTVSLIEHPQGLTLFYNQLKHQGLDLFAFSSLGLAALGSLCVRPTVVKWLGDNADWKWFVGLSMAISFVPTMVQLVYRWSLRDSLATEYSLLTEVSVASIIIPFYGAAISALTYLLLLLWSNGDMRAAIAASVWTALARFFAPPHGDVSGAVAGIVGLFLLWLSVGGLKQLQRSRQTVAVAESAEV